MRYYIRNSYSRIWFKNIIGRHTRLRGLKLKPSNSIYRRVAKLILKGDILSTDEKLKELSLLPLHGRCLFNKSLAMFKVFHGMTPNYISSVIVRSHIHGSLNFLLPKARLDLCKTSFSFSGALVWNELPQTIKQSKSLSTFKKKL